MRVLVWKANKVVILKHVVLVSVKRGGIGPDSKVFVRIQGGPTVGRGPLQFAFLPLFARFVLLKDVTAGCCEVVLRYEILHLVLL